MKYIIQESRINSLIFKYLDNMSWRLWDIGDGEFDLSDGYMDKNKINYRIKTNPVFDEEYDLIYINYDFVNKLCKLFSQPNRVVILIIIEWFNKTYDKNLSLYHDWQYQDEDEDEYDNFDD